MEQFDYIRMKDGVRLTGFHGKASRVEIPEEIGGLPVRTIGTHTFYEEGLYIESITVPGSVRVIEPGAFELCLSLHELILSEGLEQIGASAFQATGLEQVSIPATVRQIDALQEVPCALTFAEDSPFYSCDGFGIYQSGKLAGVNAPSAPAAYAIREGTESVEADVFADCPGLESLSMPASLTELPEGVLINAPDPFSTERGIMHISVDPANPVLFVEEDVLYRRVTARETSSGISVPEDSAGPNESAWELVRYFAGGEAFTVPETVVRIAREAFLKTGIRRVTIPGSVRAIGEDAFLETPLEEARFSGNTAVYFPQSDSFLLKNLLKGFGRNGKQYDFTTYDEVLQERHLNPERVRMVCSRLDNGTDLPEGRHAVLWASVLGRMEEIVQMTARRNDLELLKKLAGHGFVTEQNIDRLIRVANGEKPAGAAAEGMQAARLNGRPVSPADTAGNAGIQREVLAWLMDYKNRTFQKQAFDFSL